VHSHPNATRSITRIPNSVEKISMLSKVHYESNRKKNEKKSTKIARMLSASERTSSVATFRRAGAQKPLGLRPGRGVFVAPRWCANTARSFSTWRTRGRRGLLRRHHRYDRSCRAGDVRGQAVHAGRHRAGACLRRLAGARRHDRAARG
jgi:hypothetical protein